MGLIVILVIALGLILLLTHHGGSDSLPPLSPTHRPAVNPGNCVYEGPYGIYQSPCP